MSPTAVLALTRQCLALELGFGADIERLQNPGIYRGNDIHGTI